MKRINTALSSSCERKILHSLALMTPNFVTPDVLTLLAFISALCIGISYFFVKEHMWLLLIINFLLVTHWLADGLDGCVARVRNKERNKYGYYVDHLSDIVSLVFVLGGLLFSSLIQTKSWLIVLIFCLLMYAHTFLLAAISKRFNLSFGIFGPTEMRIALIVINFFIFFSHNPVFSFFTLTGTLTDILGVIGAFVLGSVFLCQAFSTVVYLYQTDK